MENLKNIKINNIIMSDDKNTISIYAKLENGDEIKIPMLNIEKTRIDIGSWYKKGHWIDEYYLSIPILSNKLEIKQRVKMTKAQIEENLGYEIEIVE